jgi:structural maintenance of chromosome 1
MQQLTDIGNHLRSFAKEQQLAAELTNLETRHKSVTFELDLLNEKLKKNKSERETASKQHAKLQTEATKLGKEVATLEKQIEKVQATIHAVEDQIFAQFSKAVGIENVRVYENVRQNRAKEQGDARYAARLLLPLFFFFF